MQLKSLEIFLAVIEYGSFSLAAHALHTVQSNITNHIKKLESELNCELLTRQNPIQVTSAGQQLVYYAEQMLLLHKQAKANFLEHALCTDLALNIGSMETTAAIRLPDVFRHILHQHPQFKINLHTAPTSQLIDLVQQHKLDCAFVASREPIPNFFCAHLWSEKLVLVTAKHLQLALTPEILQQQRFIAFKQGCGYRRAIELFLNDHQLPATQITEMGSLDGIMSCVSLGIGCAILPESYVQNSQFLNQVQMTEYEFDYFYSNTYLIANNPLTWSANLKKFYQLIQDYQHETTYLKADVVDNAVHTNRI